MQCIIYIYIHKYIEILFEFQSIMKILLEKLIRSMH